MAPKIPQKQKGLFYILVLNFFLLLSIFSVPKIQDLFSSPLLFLSPFVSFSVIGLILFIITGKQNLDNNLNTFLKITGLSAFGVFASILLHNLISMASVYVVGKQFEDPITLLLALLVLPFVFIFASTKTLLILKKVK